MKKSYSDLCNDIKTELAIKHGIIINDNDPILIASYMHVRYLDEQFITLLNEHKKAIEKEQVKINLVIAKNDDYKFYSFIAILIVSCILSLLIGKFFLAH
jgi:hypothetical protein